MLARRSSVLVAIAAFVLYATLCPAVPGMGDSSELDLVLATGGVAHPTGYPLWTMLGHPFVVALHAFGVAWPLAANLFSALGGALAAGFAHALGLALTGAPAAAPPRTDKRKSTAPRRDSRGLVALVAVLPVALLALHPTLADAATHAEVNTWNAAWAAGTALAFVTLLARFDTQSPRVRDAALWGALCGIGLAHHLTSVLVSAPLSIALLVALARRRALGVAPVAAALGALLVPLASYGWIAWHAWHPARVQWSLLEPSVTSVFAHVTGAQYHHLLGHFGAAGGDRGELLHVVLPFVATGVALLVFGVVRNARARLAWSGLLAAAVLGCAFPFAYGVPDAAPYFLPAMALGAGAAVPALVAFLRPQAAGGALRIALAAFVASGACAPWYLGAAHAKQACLDTEDLIRSMWSAVPDDHSIVLWPDDRFMRLVEYQLLRGEKRDLFVLMPDMLAERTTRDALARHVGFDPLAGLPLPEGGAAFAPGAPRLSLNAIVDSLNARVPQRVIVFDPSVPTVRRMRKPWEPAPHHAPAQP